LPVSVPPGTAPGSLYVGYSVCHCGPKAKQSRDPREGLDCFAPLAMTPPWYATYFFTRAFAGVTAKCSGVFTRISTERR
jgi:hypothetical protein